eukprot:TRINITY_DN2641_c0_g1_i8.p4 TRINITY_DN2641_c0_g1~~TRINITY_DN2641_c0_g1_i8.p4  ORF type:complete len:107 (-),score=25.74 TRINITY_DN2641_c0_g1_i8:459-779(-)
MHMDLALRYYVPSDHHQNKNLSAVRGCHALLLRLHCAIRHACQVIVLGAPVVRAPAGATTKKGGGGAHNWGTEDDDLAGMADGAMEAEQERMAATDSAQVFILVMV